MDSLVLESGSADTNNDDWHNVTDAKKRKQIQDRLAQRTRRKRLREAKERTQQIVRISPRPGTNVAQINDPGRFILDAHSSTCAYGQLESSVGLPSPSLSFQPSSIAQTPRLSQAPPYPITVFGALFLNGRILGMTCGSVAAKSLPQSSDVPLPLHPTPTQMHTVHYCAIDTFPFPKMRDNFIKLSAIIDETSFTHDLSTMPSFTITPGAPSWDPKSWKIEKGFADRWGFLFY